MFGEPTLDPNIVKSLDQLWKTKIPSKNLIFGWRLILNKLPTRMELAKRGIIGGAHNMVCHLWFLKDEDVEHLFCSCSISNFLWNSSCLWIGVDCPALGDSLLDRLIYFNSSSSFCFFGLVFFWSIWSCRNSILFKDRSLVNGSVEFLWRLYLMIDFWLFIEEEEISLDLIVIITPIFVGRSCFSLFLCFLPVVSRSGFVVGLSFVGVFPGWFLGCISVSTHNTHFLFQNFYYL